MWKLINEKFGAEIEFVGRLNEIKSSKEVWWKLPILDRLNESYSFKCNWFEPINEFQAQDWIFFMWINSLPMKIIHLKILSF